MKLHAEWRLIARKAWSIRLIALAGLFSGLEAVLPFFIDNLPAHVFRWATFVLTVAALISRLVAQQGFDRADAD